MKQDEFMGMAGSTLAEMRLVIEGAVALYESELAPLYTQAIAAKDAQEAATIDTLETALQTIKARISDLQTAHRETMM